MRRIKTLASALVVALLVIASLDYTASAATGHSFILGQLNKANRATVLKRTTNGPALSMLAQPSNTAPFTVNTTGKVTNLNADSLDGVDSSAFLRGDVVTLSQQRGWASQAPVGSGTVLAYANAETLTGSNFYFLSLTTPNVIDARHYYLSAVEVCYFASPGGKVDQTHVIRMGSTATAELDVADLTDRTTVAPGSCYTTTVNDSAAPAGSAYTLQLGVAGTVSIARVTSSFKAR